MKKGHQTACHNSPLMVSTLRWLRDDFHVEIRKKSIRHWHCVSVQLHSRPACVSGKKNAPARRANQRANVGGIGNEEG